MEKLNPSAFNPEARLLLDLLNQRPAMSASDINSEKLIELARFHDLSALFFYRLQNNNPGLPQNIASLLKPLYLVNISHNLTLWNEFLKINAVFTENKIAVLPLKGMDILARFYPSFDIRSMCDIDILVKEDQLADTEKVLLTLGYEKYLLELKEEYWREDQCHFVFRKGHTIVEVHWGLDFKRDHGEILPGIWDRARQVEAGKHQIKIFSPEDAVFCFALHLRRFGNVLALKQVFDSARIIGQTTDFNWDYVLEESRKSWLRSTVYFLLAQILLFTDTPIPEVVLKRFRLPFWQRKLIKRFLAKYTFLTKSPLKTNYLKAHFLLYDSIWEAVGYLINIPHEQFCKYYDFMPYTARAVLRYKLRLLYMPLRQLLSSFNAKN